MCIYDRRDNKLFHVDKRKWENWTNYNNLTSSKYCQLLVLVRYSLCADSHNDRVWCSPPMKLSFRRMPQWTQRATIKYIRQPKPTLFPPKDNDKWKFRGVLWDYVFELRRVSISSHIWQERGTYKIILHGHEEDVLTSCISETIIFIWLNQNPPSRVYWGMGFRLNKLKFARKVIQNDKDGSRSKGLISIFHFRPISWKCIEWIGQRGGFPDQVLQWCGWSGNVFHWTYDFAYMHLFSWRIARKRER